MQKFWLGINIHKPFKESKYGFEYSRYLVDTVCFKNSLSSYFEEIPDYSPPWQSDHDECLSAFTLITEHPIKIWTTPTEKQQHLKHKLTSENSYLKASEMYCSKSDICILLAAPLNSFFWVLTLHWCSQKAVNNSCGQTLQKSFCGYTFYTMPTPRPLSPIFINTYIYSHL